MESVAKKYGNRYPWDDWLAAGEVTLTRGTHFTCEPWSMMILARRAVTSRFGKKARTIRVSGDKVVIGPFVRR